MKDEIIDLTYQDRRQFKHVGKGMPVRDAVEKVTGAMKYAPDFAVQGMVHGKILRSPHAHARVVRIDASKALQVPGVLGVVSHEDAPRTVWDGCWFNYRGVALEGIVRFVGDEVAAVAATTERAALQALKLIEVEYEVLPAVFTAEAAMQEGAPEIRAEGNAREPYTVAWGDMSKGVADAAFVIETEIDYGSQQMASIGRNACIAEWHGDRVTVWTGSQTPSELRTGLAMALDIPQSKVRVQAFPTGSSFGLWWSNNFMMVTALLARKVRRPVKIELDNAECFATVKRRHKEQTRGRIGVAADGRITLIEIDHLMDNGGYGFKNDVGFFCVDNWGHIENGRCTVRGVSTNLVTAGCMRGVGDVTLGNTVERLCDMAAARLGIDPLSFRLRNQIRAGEPLNHIMGYDVPEVAQVISNSKAWMGTVPKGSGVDWPEPFRLLSGSTQEILMRGAQAFGWADKWKGWGVPYAVDGALRRAVGVGTGIHCCGVELEGNTSAVVRVNPDGSVKLFCAVGRHGQGSETTQSQVAAEALGVPIDAIEIETGDTDSCPWSHGSIASNTMYRTGFATWSAARDARRQILEVAAKDVFDCDPADLDIDDGIVKFVAKHRRDNRTATIAEVLGTIRKDALGQFSSVVGRTAITMPPSTTFARHFAAHFVDLEVDVETGQIRLLDYLACQDSGTVVNPKVLMNQVIGGAICGAGFAIYEALEFDKNTGAVRNAGLLDYKVLRSGDFPSRARVLFGDSYDPVGPFGARGAGEAPIAAPIPAISQAVYNATGHWFDLPMNPERIVRTLSGAASA
jgi:xanthine dehydrogenase molybdenum-binding subunit